MSKPTFEWTPSNCVTLRFDGVTVYLDYHTVASLAHHFVSHETSTEDTRAEVLRELLRQANN